MTLEARVETAQKPNEIDQPVKRSALAMYDRIDSAARAGIASPESVRIDGRAVVITAVHKDDVDTINDLITPSEM